MRNECCCFEEIRFGKLTISESDLLDPEMVIQLGFPPVRIDLITSLGTAKFDDLYEKKSAVRLEE